ncbi:arsinothricin resistance N-acetyltransferase ArsN1 [Paenibacillus sp. LS1]|uniref:arsinothricin resistance N-acetyltransferase ArsN1 family A n=1 Tax=Paenibacillus sp. LS1 TaxID=2992120 RepID=UPI00222F71A0|nr:arsinothricin resistance N-acetyltransferase ArsN1 family A [Paenibacillus sp. LS1]MCW3794467.1 arsinothricin resistance N-acetyltransferase ArsN1 [Paenibacillus sp. LS1]
MLIRRATVKDAYALASIYNQAIEERNATFETESRSIEDREQWILNQGERYPILVAELNDLVLGFASVSAYRARNCYDGVGEFSVYIDRQSRGQGVGRRLLEELILECKNIGYWKLVSRVFDFNVASRALCKRCGFREVGVYEKHGQLDGQWLNCVIVEKIMDTTIH